VSVPCRSSSVLYVIALHATSVCSASPLAVSPDASRTSPSDNYISMAQRIDLKCDLMESRNHLSAPVARRTAIMVLAPMWLRGPPNSSCHPTSGDLLQPRPVVIVRRTRSNSTSPGFDRRREPRRRRDRPPFRGFLDAKQVCSLADDGRTDGRDGGQCRRCRVARPERRQRRVMATQITNTLSNILRSN